MSGGVPTWSSGSASTAHELLSATHTDTQVATVSRGSLITGQNISGTDYWAELEIGTVGQILRSDGTDVSWADTTAITELGTISTGTWNADVIDVSFGGTGASSFTSKGVLYGNGSSALGVTAAGSSGQILIATSDGTPAFVSMSGDVSINSTGATTIQADSVGTSEIIDNSITEPDLNIANTPTAGYILKWNGTTFEWAQETGGSGASKWTDAGTFTYLTNTTDDILIGGSTSDTASFFFDVSASTLTFEGSTADSFETTLAVSNPASDITITLPSQSGTVALTSQLHNAVTLNTTSHD